MYVPENSDTKGFDSLNKKGNSLQNYDIYCCACPEEI
jgi:hypothetical protein